eukprot:Seg135.2 transcript_id=Seg135.2/GoldUCD/mRNA.D3Y31 product="Zinc finger protein 678" protein_id=Seg135.2/GoldUCD/D3Y31
MSTRLLLLLVLLLLCFCSFCSLPAYHFMLLSIIGHSREHRRFRKEMREMDSSLKNSFDQSSAYECLICGEVLHNFDNLQDHQLSHMENNEGNDKSFLAKTTVKTELPEKEIKTELTYYECLICGEDFEVFEDLEKHHESHLNGDDPCSSNEVTLVLKSLEDEQTAGDSDEEELSAPELPYDKQYTCKVCGQIFTQCCHLKRHQRIHTGEKLFSCQKCHKDFGRKESWRRHMISHSGIRKFSCKFCDKRFLQPSHLEKHERTHTGQKPYVCKVCWKSFNQQSTMSRHQSTHTSEKPFSCEQCGKKFGRFGSLKRHEIIHTGLKPYKCDKCKKRFNRSCYLGKHKREYCLKRSKTDEESNEV